MCCRHGREGWVRSPAVRADAASQEQKAVGESGSQRVAEDGDGADLRQLQDQGTQQLRKEGGRASALHVRLEFVMHSNTLLVTTGCGARVYSVCELIRYRTRNSSADTCMFAMFLSVSSPPCRRQCWPRCCIHCSRAGPAHHRCGATDHTLLHSGEAEGRGSHSGGGGEGEEEVGKVRRRPHRQWY